MTETAEENAQWDRILVNSTMQVSAKLRRGEGRYFHWCPGCQKLHPLPDSWTFNGNVDKPTFSPSFLHDQSRPERRCHYILTDGVLNFCADSTAHQVRGAVPLPDLPEALRDTDKQFAYEGADG